MARTIGGPGGGSPKGSGGSGVFLLGVGLAVALGIGGTGVVGSALGGSGGSVSASSRGSSKVGSRDSAAAQARIADVVLVAASWVEMADAVTARRLKELVDASGSGNVTELSRERGRFKAVRYTGDFYASRLDGAVVSNAQVQPVARGRTGLALTVLVNDALA